MKSITITYRPERGCAVSYAEQHQLDFAHGCNTRGVMGAGVAAVVRRKYPLLARTDHEMSSRCETSLGSFIRIPHPARYARSRSSFVYNFYTQVDPGPGSLSYQAIRQCFIRYFTTRLVEESHTSLVIPEIGCGLGGGFRLKVLYQIRKALECVEVPPGKSASVLVFVWGSEGSEGWKRECYDVQKMLTSDIDRDIDSMLSESYGCVDTDEYLDSLEDKCYGGN